MSSIKTVTDYLETLAPLELQESYDNSGLQVGDEKRQLTGVLVCLDCTEEVLEEALKTKSNLVISHHPLIFNNLKSITGRNHVGRILQKAIKKDIAIYSIHTNLDNIAKGVNSKFAEKLGLKDLRILRPLSNLQKLVTFVPVSATKDLLAKLHRVGAGNIGNYSECSFIVNGQGNFKPGSSASPKIGKANSHEIVNEDRIEIIFPNSISDILLATLKQEHPYEEAPFYLNRLENLNQDTGAGMIGALPETLDAEEFLAHLKTSLSLTVIKYTKFKRKIKSVAICGGSGSFLLKDAINQKADAFVTADIKYHDFFNAEGQLLFCDVGHYESEVATKELLYELLTKKFTNFALHLSKTGTNPINFYK